MHLNTGDVFQADLRYAAAPAARFAGHGDRARFSADLRRGHPGRGRRADGLRRVHGRDGRAVRPDRRPGLDLYADHRSPGNAAPIIVEGPRSDPYYVRGTSTQLSALAADDGAEKDLQYIWEVLSVPAGAGPVLLTDNGTNTAKVTTATFARSGTYTFRLTVRDRVVRDAEGNLTGGGHLTMSDPIRVEVAQVLGEFVVTPAAPTVMSGAAVKIAFQQFDQFGDSPIGGIGSWGWTIDGPGYIDTGYFYNAPPDWTGPVTIRATNGTATASATINVVDLPPELDRRVRFL